MVLSQTNFSKRIYSNSENTPPFSSSSIKSLASRLRNSLHDTTRRRRARVTGGAQKNAHYAVEQAKRRSETKSPSGSVRFNVTTIPRTPPQVPDVEMKDAEPTPSAPIPPPISTKNVMLPKELLRPEYREVSSEAIKAVYPDLVDADVDYIREQLEEFGPHMLKVLSTVKADPHKDTLPKELAILINDLTSDAPTHLLAIYAPLSTTAPAVARRRVTLFPIHSVILASYCSSLPPLPPSTPTPVDTEGGEQIVVPVVPLCLPSPQTFPHLSAFLYNKRTSHLLTSLLPCAPPPSLERDKAQLLPFATKLAGTYTAQALLQNAMMINGVWRNACALGVFDDDLWGTMDLAWEVVLTALAIGTGNPHAMLGSTSQPTPS